MPLDGAEQAVGQRDPWRPTECRADVFVRGDASVGLVEALSIVGCRIDRYDRCWRGVRRFSDEFGNGSCKLLDRRRCFGADVEDTSDRQRVAACSDGRGGDVVHVGQRADLRPIAVDRDWAAVERLRDEAGNHRTRPTRGRPRSITIEVTQHADGEPCSSRVEHEMFVECLAERITPTGRSWCANDQVVVFAHRNRGCAAVDLARRCEHESRRRVSACGDDGPRPVDVRLDRCRRISEYLPYTDDRSQVEDNVDRRHQVGQRRHVTSGAFDKSDVVAALGQIVERAGRQVIEHGDLRTAGDELIDNVRPDMAGSSGDQGLHDVADSEVTRR